MFVEYVVVNCNSILHKWLLLKKGIGVLKRKNNLN